MKKILTVLAATAVMLTAGYSNAYAFSDYSAKCSNCHNSSRVGKIGSPKKFILPDKNEPVANIINGANSLKSVKINRDLVIDGKGSDALWKQAPELKVKTSWLSPNSPKDPAYDTSVVSLKSLYNNKKIYILATWADPNPDLEKDRWEYKDGKWAQNKNYDEDRLAIQWDINAEGFNRVGCAITCHGYTKDFGKYTNNPGQSVDLWHWKSTRSNPMNWTDDGFVRYVAPEEVGTKKGRSADSGTGGEIKNEQTIDDVKLPKYIADSAKVNPQNPFLFASSAALFNQVNIDKTSVIPGYVITDANSIGVEQGPTGSRADVRTYANWENGRWTLEIVRDLETGNKDDVSFREGTTTAFGLASFNNNTNFNHAVSNVLFLELKSTPQSSSVSKTKTNESQFKQQNTGKVTAWFLNMRSGPGMKYKITRVLKKGEKVVILNKSGNWLLVKTVKGKTGYVYSRWINSQN